MPEFSVDMWASLGSGLEEFLEKQGMKNEIIQKSPEKVVIGFEKLAQYYITQYGQILLDNLENTDTYENFIRLIQNVISNFHPNPNRLKFIAIRNMKMRLGITKITDFVSQSYGKMICIRAILRNITEKNPKIAHIVFGCDACGQNSVLKVETDFFTNKDKYGFSCRHCLSKKIREVERVKDTVVRLKFEDPSETSEYSHRLASCYGQAKNVMQD